MSLVGRVLKRRGRRSIEQRMTLPPLPNADLPLQSRMAAMSSQLHELVTRDVLGYTHVGEPEEKSVIAVVSLAGSQSTCRSVFKRCA